MKGEIAVHTYQRALGAALLAALLLTGCGGRAAQQEAGSAGDAHAVTDSTDARGSAAETEAASVPVTAQQLGLADGTYTADVTLSGGTGRAEVQSPAQLAIEDGAVTATIVWSSANYDYMVVGGEKYEPATFTPGSTFVIPVDGFDAPIAVTADTTAMSEPHEIDYALTFDAQSVKAAP